MMKMLALNMMSGLHKRTRSPLALDKRLFTAFERPMLCAVLSWMSTSESPSHGLTVARLSRNLCITCSEWKVTVMMDISDIPRLCASDRTPSFPRLHMPLILHPLISWESVNDPLLILWMMDFHEQLRMASFYS